MAGFDRDQAADFLEDILVEEGDFVSRGNRFQLMVADPMAHLFIDVALETVGESAFIEFDRSQSVEHGASPQISGRANWSPGAPTVAPVSR